MTLTTARSDAIQEVLGRLDHGLDHDGVYYGLSSAALEELGDDESEAIGLIHVISVAYLANEMHFHLVRDTGPDHSTGSEHVEEFVDDIFTFFS